MKAERAIEILEMLMEGIDPYTGEALPQAFLFEQADVITALCSAVESLKRDISSDKTRQKTTKSGKANAGRAWTKEEDQQLAALAKSGASLERMCTLLQRRPRGIKNRLSKLEIPSSAMTDDAKPARLGAPWLSEEDDLLERMFESGRTMAEMQRLLQRSERGIAYRLQHLQLIDDTEDYLAETWQEKKYDKDDMKDHFLQGETVADLARRYHITKQAAQARLFYMGLSREAPELYRREKEEDQ